MCLTGLPKWKFQEPPLINILGHDYSKQSKSTAQCAQSAIFITRYIFIHTAAVPIGNFEEDSLFHCQPLQVWHQQNLQTVIRRFNNETSHLFWNTAVFNTTYILDTPYIQCFTIMFNEPYILQSFQAEVCIPKRNYRNRSIQANQPWESTKTTLQQP